LRDVGQKLRAAREAVGDLARITKSDDGNS
jgi:hypothetical protein